MSYSPATGVVSGGVVGRCLECPDVNVIGMGEFSVRTSSNKLFCRIGLGVPLGCGRGFALPFFVAFFPSIIALILLLTKVALFFTLSKGDVGLGTITLL